MKRVVCIGVFVFSLALNLAVAVTLGGHLWCEHRSPSVHSSASVPALTSEEVKQIRNLCLKQNGGVMIEARKKILEKNFQLLDLMAQHPVDTAAVDKCFTELVELKRQTEKGAIDRISNVMATLPPERRQAFAVFLKNRSCMLPGMGFSHGWRKSTVDCPMPAMMEHEASR